MPSLKDQFSVYGVNYPNLMDGDMISYPSLEALAADYIKKIKAVSPQGPYRLGGWSLGGNISLEITRQLQAAGEKVELLLLLDTRYQPYREMVEHAYFELFMLELIQESNPDVAPQSHHVPRRLKIAYDVYHLFEKYQAKEVGYVEKILFIKCQMSLVNLANQRITNIDWSQFDLLNGLRHYLSLEQNIHVRDILCDHFELLDDAQKDILNELISSLLLEKKEDSYQINNPAQNIAIALQKGAIYQLRQLQAETENIFRDIIRRENSNSSPRDIESGYQPYSSDQLLLEAMSDLRKNHRLNIKQLLSVMHYTIYFTWHIITLLGEVSPTYMTTDILNLTQKLLILRFISSESTALVAASVLDETLLSMMLFLAKQMNFPLVNYLNVALSKKDDQQVGRTFNAALVLGMTLLVPMCIYGSLAPQIGNAIGIEQEVIDAWRPLALIHILAALPALANLTMEMFYQTTYQRRMPPFGALFETAPTLLAVLLFKHYGTLNGLSLGLSLSIGSFCKSFFYLQQLAQTGHIQQYGLFQNISLAFMKQYLHDSRLMLTSSLFIFSNYVVLACLLGSKNGAVNLTGYAVARSTYDLINLTNTIIAASSGLLTGRFVFENQFHNAFKTSIISLAIALSLAGMTSIALSATDRKTLTQLFINTHQIPIFAQDQFFTQVQASAYYFIGLGLANSLRIPLTTFLNQSFAYHEMQKITFFTALILANAAMLAIFFGSNSDSKILICTLFSANLLATVLMLYQWLKISDFQCSQVSKNKLSFIEKTTEKTAEEELNDAELGIPASQQTSSIRISQNRYALLAAPGQSKEILQANFEIAEQNSTVAQY